MVLTLEFLGIRPIRACAGEADSDEGYTRWYSRILRTVVYIDVRDDSFILLHRAMQTIYRLAKSHDVGAVRGESVCVSRSKRHASSLHHDRLERTISIRQSYTSKRAKASNRSSDSSPMVKLSLSQASTPSARASPRSAAFVPSYQGVVLDPFLPTEDRGDRDPSAYIHPPSDGGGESPASRAQISAMDPSKPALGQKIR